MDYHHRSGVNSRNSLTQPQDNSFGNSPDINYRRIPGVNMIPQQPQWSNLVANFNYYQFAAEEKIRSIYRRNQEENDITSLKLIAALQCSK
jgi:hypothetical protein